MKVLKTYWLSFLFIAVLISGSIALIVTCPGRDYLDDYLEAVEVVEYNKSNEFSFKQVKEICYQYDKNYSLKKSNEFLEFPNLETGIRFKCISEDKSKYKIVLESIDQKIRYIEKGNLQYLSDVRVENDDGYEKYFFDSHLVIMKDNHICDIKIYRSPGSIIIAFMFIIFAIVVLRFTILDIKEDSEFNYIVKRKPR